MFADFHRLEMREDHEYPRHRHAVYEAIRVERGPYLCELNETELSVKAGEVLIIKPGDWHADHLRRGQRHCVLHFTLRGERGVEPELFAPGVAAQDQIARGGFAEDVALIGLIREEAERAADHAAAVQDGILGAMFWRWTRGLPRRALSRMWRELPATEARAEELGDLLRRHVADNPTVAALAREAGCSPRQLTNQCRALLGGSPARVLLDMKLAEAEAMLRHQRMRVSEVSDALGFANPFHFSKVCRRLWGLPPSALLGETASRRSRRGPSDDRG